jgi:hypothetical protein
LKNVIGTLDFLKATTVSRALETNGKARYLKNCSITSMTKKSRNKNRRVGSTNPGKRSGGDVRVRKGEKLENERSSL